MGFTIRKKQKTVPYVVQLKLNLYKDKSIFRDLGVNLKIWLVFLNQIYILMLYPKNASLVW